MMRDAIPADELLAKSHAVGQYYGFVPLSSLTAQLRGKNRTKSADASLPQTRLLDPIADIVALFLKQFRNVMVTQNLRQPLFVWHTNIASGRQAKKRAIIQYHALGSDHSLADVVVIRALMSLIRDIFHEDPVVRINSMGDRETRARYARELTNFFKKKSASLPEAYVTRARVDVFEAAELMLAHNYADDLPEPSEHLSDASRKRLKDLLEYMEMTETPYEFARTLMSRSNAWSDTCFEFVVAGKRVAWGSRYQELARHLLTHPNLHATGAVFYVASHGNIVRKVTQSRTRFTFVHIGDEAKRLSLKLAEDFRKARVPLVQNIGIQSLSEQFSLAERHRTPYLLIMGRKEALEGSAILRNTQTHEETILPLNNIIDRLKSFA